MNRFERLNKEQLAMVNETGYIIEDDKEYSEEDYEKCASFICDYIMSHSKNEIPKIESKFNEILRIII